MNLIVKYGYDDFFKKQEGSETKNYIVGRIIEAHRELYKVVCVHGEVEGVLKGSTYYHEGSTHLEAFPTTGDFVFLKYHEQGRCSIVKTLKRKTLFERSDEFVARGAQAVAANFDYVFITASLNYDFNLRRIERYLAVAWQSGGMPIVVLTKSDLVSEEEAKEKVAAVERIGIGVAVIPISAHTGAGVTELQPYLQEGKTIVLLGSSGVGKSSLVNALAQKGLMEVKAIREDDSKGRHTTTHRQLIMLDSGVMILDTPGMRELGIWDAGEGIRETFSDIEELFERCQFSDCTHDKELGCAVQQAIKNGILEKSRWRNYCTLQKEAKYAEEKIAIRMKQQKNKNSAKTSKKGKLLKEKARDNR